MRFTAALVALSLCACAAPPVQPEKAASEGMRVVWVRVDNVTKECGNALGCYRIRGGTCFVYTRHARVIFDVGLHQVLGHEIQHCFDGDFHGGEARVVHMNQWRH